MERFLELLRIRSRKIARPIILVGADYSAHCVSSSLANSDEYRVVAIIDDEPWTHRTVMNGAVIHYPGELLALVERYDAEAVISFENEGYRLEGALVKALGAMQICCIEVPRNMETAAAKLHYIRSYLDRRDPSMSS